MSKTKHRQRSKCKSNYISVLKLVENGMNISDAIEKIGISRTTFYRNINEQQKAEIYAAKKTHTKYGMGHKYK